MESSHIVTIPPSLAGIRIDRAIAELMPTYSRSYIQRLIDSGSVSIDNRVIHKAHSVAAPHSTITILLKSSQRMRAESATAAPYAITIIAEHTDFMIINKPAGILVHPAGSAPGIPTVTDWLMDYYPQAAAIGDQTRPGIIHRLDKDTSGLLIIAKEPQAYYAFSKLFAQRAIKKSYHALVVGTPPEQGTIDFNIMRHPHERIRMTHSRQYGKSAYTSYKVINRYTLHTMLALYPSTGRTHQLRVHCAASGFPILGDTLYGAPETALIKRQALHACELSFIYNNREHSYRAELPEDMRFAITHL